MEPITTEIPGMSQKLYRMTIGNALFSRCPRGELPIEFKTMGEFGRDSRPANSGHGTVAGAKMFAG